jgi:chemotaxis protein MotB
VPLFRQLWQRSLRLRAQGPQRQILSVHRQPSYHSRPPSPPVLKGSPPLPEEQWSVGRERLVSHARWFALSTAAHILLLATLATLVLPSPFASRKAPPVPVTLLPSAFPAQAQAPRVKTENPEDKLAALPPADETLQALQTFRQNWLARAERVERTLVEVPDALAAKDQTIALQQKQLATVSEEQTRLSGELQRLTAQEATLSALLTQERERARTLEAELTERLRQKEEELSGTKEAYGQLVAGLQREIARKEITLRQAKEQLSIAIVDRVLFPSGQATLTPEGLRVLEKVGTVLAKVADRKIQVEGHTDNVEIGPGLKKTFPSNWELSTARATEVVKYLITHARLPAERLMAVGRADTVSVAPNTTEEGRQQNRRIEIILLPPERIGEEGGGAVGLQGVPVPRH